MAYATRSDVEHVLLRDLTAAELPRVERLLRFAEAAVRSQVPTVEARLAAGTIDEDLLASVVAAMVARALRNPEGLKSETETAGPFAHTRVQGPSAGLIRMLPDEVSLLAPSESDLGQWSGSIRLRRP